MVERLPIIGIAGRRGAGKDTLAKALEPHGFVRVAFADKLKEIVRDLYGLSHEQVHGTIEQKETVDPRWGVTPRHLMQVFGTEVARHAHAETWVRYLLDVDLPRRRTLLASGEHPAGYAVADVRFPNEAQAIRDRDGIVVLIERPGMEAHTVGHVSEEEVDRIVPDWTFVNEEIDDMEAAATILARAVRVRGTDDDRFVRTVRIQYAAAGSPPTWRLHPDDYNRYVQILGQSSVPLLPEPTGRLGAPRGCVTIYPDETAPRVLP